MVQSISISKVLAFKMHTVCTGSQLLIREDQRSSNDVSREKKIKR